MFIAEIAQENKPEFKALLVALNLSHDNSFSNR